MRSFFKTLFSPKSLKSEKSLSRPIPPNLSNPKPNANLSNKIFAQKNYPLGSPLNQNNSDFLAKIRRENAKDDKEMKIYWLERWYLFRDRRLILPFEKFIYLNLVILGVLKKLLLKNPTLLSATLKTEAFLDRLQRNPKARLLFLPTLMLIISLMVSGFFVRII